ncbi:MAG: hypothetical protein OES09_04880 [Gammaproteobacteria bacterium]|nr:hypothetical protein [Gammaproteobacteria bacterium]
MEQQSRDFERIVPTEFEVTNPARHKPHDRTRRRRWRVGFGMITAALLVVVLWVVLRPATEVAIDEVPPDQPAPSDAAAPDRSSVITTGEEPSPPAPSEAPWRDTELAAARRAAQDTLAQVSEKKRELEAQRIDLWSAKAFTDALDSAAQGDALYQQRRFDEAQDRYRESLDQLRALSERISTVLEEALARGATALADGAAASAVDAFELVLAIAPDNAAAQTGLARAKVLDQVKQVLQSAQEREQVDDLEAAKAEYERALALDGRTELAREGMRRIDQKLGARAFTAAMSRGYAALKESRLDAAKRAFATALKLKPGAEDAQNALAMTANRKTELSIQSWLREASEHERKEKWGEAVRAYQKVLALDGSVAAARAGVDQAKTRAELDARLTTAIAAPERLQDEGVYREVQQWRTRAGAVRAPGPRLRAQIDALDGLLRLAIEPVLVTLKSDDATDVNVYKVGRLGTFRSKVVELKPGRYIAVGTREGYRDVRREFRVTAGQRSISVVVECTEKVVF